MKNKSDFIWITVSVISFLMFSMSFILMAVESKDVLKGISITSLLAGIFFWIFLLMSTVSQIVISKRTKKWLSVNKVRRSHIKKKMGVFSFFQNKYATIADITAVASFIGLLVSLIATNAAGQICYIFLSLFIFSFSMHCFLNSKSFYVLTNKDKILGKLRED